MGATDCNILYVDDEEINLRMFKSCFRNQYKIHTAISGKEGLKILNSTPINLILTDQRMPNMTGLEFLTRAKVDYPNISRIIITGFSDMSIIQKAVNELELFKYIEKPWDPIDLGTVIDNALELDLLRNRESEAKLKLFASQMNPHFIFNSMYSIIHYINEGNLDSARDFIVDFANLMRKTLDNSTHKFITIEQEIGFLNTFLELEALRFPDQLSYNITIDGNLNAEELKIPPMLIQPYVENAILHGIKNKTTPGKVEVIFADKGDYILCSIIDDGIGMKKAKEINEKNYGKGHKSRAMGITESRMEILNSLGPEKYELEFIDLEKGNATGTQVNITIPKRINTLKTAEDLSFVN